MFIVSNGSAAIEAPGGLQGASGLYSRLDQLDMEKQEFVYVCIILWFVLSKVKAAIALPYLPCSIF